MNPTLHVACPYCNTTNRVASERLHKGPTCGQCKRPLLPSEPVELTQANFDRQIAARYGIRSIPTLIAFRNGREVARQSGALGAPQLLQWIDAHVASK